MLFFSNLLKNTRVSTTSVISLLCHLFVLLFFFILYKTTLKESDFNTVTDIDNGIITTDVEIFYFTVVTHSTLGFGDITPKSKKCKELVTAHMFIVILLIAFFGSN